MPSPCSENDEVEMPSADDVAIRTARRYLKLCFSCADRCRKGGKEAVSALAELRMKSGNVADSQAWAASNRESSEDAWKMCWQFPFALGVLGVPALGESVVIGWNKEGLLAASEVSSTEFQGRLFMHCHANLGATLWSQGDIDGSILHYQTAIKHARTLQEPTFEAQLQLDLAMIKFERGNTREAIKVLGDGLALIPFAVDPRTAALLLHNLGLFHLAAGQDQEAKKLLESSVRLAESAGFLELKAVAHGGLANLAKRHGHVAKARSLCHQALEAARTLGDREIEGTILLAVGIIEYEERRLDDASQLGDKALAIFDSIPDRRGQGRALALKGAIQYSLGDHDRAIAFHNESLALARSIGDDEGEQNAIHNVSSVELRAKGAQNTPTHRLTGWPQIASLFGWLRRT